VDARRTTLANERVSLASGSAYGGALEACLELLSSQPDLVDESGVLDRLGSLLVKRSHSP